MLEAVKLIPRQTLAEGMVDTISAVKLPILHLSITAVHAELESAVIILEDNCVGVPAALTF